jgi:ATP-dependent Clp protease ATP-binding subunit ClpB
LKEEVDAEEVAEIVSTWTHIPVSRLMEGETQKLLHMEIVCTKGSLVNKTPCG